MRNLFLICILVALNASAQDVIVKKDGNTILSKVLEVNRNDIKYKKYSNQNGPIYSIDKFEIISINYENGDRDTFDVTTIKNDDHVSSRKMIYKTSSSNNSSLVNKYNGDIQFSKYPSNKKAKCFFPIMAVSDSSIMSTDEVEMRFVPVTVYDRNCNCYDLRYCVELENKTDKIIYVDLANSFKINADKSFISYYNTESTIVSNGESRFKSNTDIYFGVLGTLANSITSGKSLQNTVTTSYSKERILSIPPHATANLAEYQQIKIKKKRYKTISDIEKWSFSLCNPKGKIKKNGHVLYNEEDTPYTNNYIITYSTSQDFSTYSLLNTKIYARYIVGSFYSYFFSNRNNLIKKIQEFIPDFGANPYILMGGCSKFHK